MKFGYFLAEEDTWGKILNDIFSLELGQYENLGFGDFAFDGLRGMIIAFFAGIVIASYLSIFNRRVHGEFVRSLIEENCATPETGKTLSELGYMKNTVVRSAIKGGHIYRGVIRCVEADEYNAAVEQSRGEYEARAAASGEKAKPFRAAPFAYDFSCARFYVPEDIHFTATSRFDKKGTSIFTAIVITIVSIVALWAVLKFLPDALQLVDNFVGMLTE